MKKDNNILDRYIVYFLPLAFIGSGFLNMYAFVLDGHAHEWFRQGFVLGIQGIAVLAMLEEVFFLWRKRKQIKSLLIGPAVILAVFCVLYVWALLLRESKNDILKSMIVNGGYLLAEILAVVIICAKRIVRDFFRCFRIYALILSPVVLYYCVRFYLPNAEYGVESFGVYPAMTLSYTLLVFCLILAIEPVVFGTETSRAGLTMGMVLFSLFSVAMTLAQCKGALFCLAFGLLLLLFYAVASKQKARVALEEFVIGCVVILLFSTTLFPNYSKNRVTALQSELMDIDSSGITSGDIHRTNEFFALHEDILGDAIMENAANTGDATVKLVTSGKAKEMLEKNQITPEEYEELVEMSRKLNNTNVGGRLWLWNCAIEEIKSAPLIGHGPMSFQDQYGTYPHNFFLELATDYGAPLTVVIAILGAVILFSLARCAITDKNQYVTGFILVVFAMLPKAMLSGTIYGADSFFQYGFCAVIWLMLRKKSAEKTAPDTAESA